MATISEALAVALQDHQAGRLQAAEQIYRQILAVEPHQAEALHLLGMMALEAGKPDVAVECISRAIASNGAEARFHNNLGYAFQAQGKLVDAIPSFRRAVELRPDSAEVHYNLGNALQAQGKLPDAVPCYRRALELRPDLVEAHHNLGNAFLDQGMLEEAVACLRLGLKLKPDYAEAQNTLGNAFKAQGRLDDSLAWYRRALELKPEYTQAHSNLVFTLSYSPGHDAKAIYEEARRWNHFHAEPLARLIRPHGNERTPDRRLRIGYVSPDFRDHCQALFTVPLLSAHDRQNYEIYCYADVAYPDATTSHLRSLTDAWRSIVGRSDEQIAQFVRQDQIDVLVDLTMHMANNRALLFARKPAPVQACWLAYPGTTGLSTIDYRLTDVYLDPPSLYDRYYAEESIRLPDTFWCYDPLTREPAVNSLPAREKGYVTFGCLNNFCKVNAAVLELWAQVLRSVQHSRIVILAPEGISRQRTLALLVQENIAPERVFFVAYRPRPQYLELYQYIDVGLDTFPYNGHTTSLDSFWMGVPVITLVGQTVVGRAGLSQLTNLGLPELIAKTPEQFVSIAVELAGDLPRLSQLRATLRERMQGSALMDAPRFARNIEAAYRGMWQRWCAK